LTKGFLSGGLAGGEDGRGKERAHGETLKNIEEGRGDYLDFGP
jgi:hypothetical protein